MLFNSYIFVFLFLPISLAGYYVTLNKIGAKAAKIWLAAMSLWFYGSFRTEYLFLLLGSVVWSYAFGRWVNIRRVNIRRESSQSQQSRTLDKSLLAAGIVGNLSLLVYFKYMNFFIGNLNAVSGGQIPLLQVLLPVGISFFTFQQISYLVDCYHGEIKNCGFLDYLLYIIYFPKLVEGPIVLHGELLSQFAVLDKKEKTAFDGDSFVRGIVLFILGMLKKVVQADTFGQAVDYGYSNLNIMHSLDALLLVFFYALQLYFDFSGFCDMARGISAMFGIMLPVNFNSPYKAVNIIDFWKRWHITLNRFFTKYVYIPLGGNRKGTAKMYRNLLIIFLLSGIWHGAGWNFILWGMMHGILYIFTRMWQKRSNYRPAEGIVKAACVILTFLYVSAAWVYFRADSVAQGNQLLSLILQNDFVRVNRNLAGYFNIDEFWYILKVLKLDKWEWGHYILMTAFTAISLLLVFFGKNAAETAEQIKLKTWNAILFAGLFLWCVLTFGNVSVFLYFNF